MSFVALVTHGLSAMAVQVDVIGVRLLVATLLCCLALGFALACVLGIKTVHSARDPDLASTVFMLLVVLMTQTSMLALGFVFMTLQSVAEHVDAGSRHDLTPPT